MTEMYLVTRILDEMSYSFINTEVFGDVEIRNSKNDMEIEKKYFEQSATSVFGKPLNISDYQFSNRISIIVCAENHSDAVNAADEKFVQVLDLKSNSSAIISVGLSKIAIARNLVTGEIKHHVDTDYFKSRFFIKRNSDIQKYNLINYIIDNKNSNPDSLASRFSRSVHWSHLANDEKNKQLRLLFNYFCLENLFSINERDNIEGVVRCFMGFPAKKRHRHIKKEILDVLINDSNYNHVLNNMVGLFDLIRDFRNDSVHSGLRYFDINEDKLSLYDAVFKFCKLKSIESVEYALSVKKIKTLDEFKNNMWDIFNEIADAKYITGTIAFSLSKYF